MKYVIELIKAGEELCAMVIAQDYKISKKVFKKILKEINPNSTLLK